MAPTTPEDVAFPAIQPEQVPICWNSNDKDAEIELTLERRRAHRLPGAEGNLARVRANAPATSSATSSEPIFYFEVVVIARRGDRGIGVGISVQEDNPYGVSVPEIRLDRISSGFVAKPGDVIGCGLDFSKGACFYTFNGIEIEAGFSGLPPRPFPAVYLANARDVVDVNFGQDPFLFDLAMAATRARNAAQRRASEARRREEVSAEDAARKENFPDTLEASLPARWRPDDPVAFRLTENDRGVQRVSAPEIGVAGSVKSDQAAPAEVGVYYFEAKVKRKEAMGLLSVGFESNNKKIMYRSDGLCSYGGKVKVGQVYSGGDVVGCCINFLANSVFFVLNGSVTAELFTSVAEEAFYPAAELAHPGEEIVANFGQSKFQCDFREIATSRTKFEASVTSTICIVAADVGTKNKGQTARIRCCCSPCRIL